MQKFALINIYKKFDIFGQRVTFSADGRESVTSCLGATISILVTILTFAYAWTRFDILMQFGDTKHQETLDYREDYDNEMFDQSDTNFNIALGMRKMIGTPNGGKAVDEIYGYLDVYVFFQGQDGLIGLHNCTSEDRDLFYEEIAQGERKDSLEDNFK